MATPFVVAAVSGVSGLVMSGTQSITSQWVQTGDLSKTDWLKVGKDAAIGGITGFVTGYLGASIGGAITSKLTGMAGSALNSTSTVTRVATHAAIGSVSEIGSGTATRFAGNMITSGGNVQESLQTAFDPKSMLFDGVIGGVSGGVKGKKAINSIDDTADLPKTVGDGNKDSTAYHSVGGDNASKKIQSVLDGIDISYTSPDSRFGQGFYVAAEGDTTIAELVYHGTDATYSIRYDMNLGEQKVLDLTNSSIASNWGYIQNKSTLIECQSIAEKALDEGYSVIKVQSYRSNGINYVIYDNFDDILSPQMVTPISN